VSNPPPVPPGEAEGSGPPAIRIKPRRLPGDRGPAPVLAIAWASFFGSGYAPIAPGTAGTAAAIPLWWALTYAGPWIYFAATAVIVVTGIAAAQRAGVYYGVADSGHIVIDEVAGYLVTMAFLPRTAFAALAGFLLFRVCDVLKPWPASVFDREERWKNGAGVMLDDLFAGLWALALTWGAVLLQRRVFPP
jgi:phosphatidylglycerophosphatase A